MKALAPDDPLLRKVSNPLLKQELKKKSVQSEIEKLLSFVYSDNTKGKTKYIKRPMTVGLSANQVGILKRISIVDLAIGKKDFNDIHVLINPEIVLHSKSQTFKSEGCVNLPQIFGFVKRYKKIKVKAMDRSGNELLLTLENWPAILLQHEIDHLNGKLFIDHLEDPTKAHLVTKDNYKNYSRTKKSWDKLVDVSNLIAKSS